MTSHMDRRSALLAALSTAVASIAARAQAQTPAGEPEKPLPPRPPISAYAASPLVDEIALSPDGTRIAIISSKGDEKVLAHFRLNEDAQFLVMGAIKVRGLFWVDNSHLMLINSQTARLEGFVGNKHEFSQAQCINVDTNKVINLFGDQKGFYNVVMGDVQRIRMDGKYFVTASNYKFDERGHLYLCRFDPDHSLARTMVIGSEYTDGFVICPDGRVLAYYDYEESAKTWELRFNTAAPGKSDNFKLVYTQKVIDDLPSVMGPSADGQKVVVFIDDDKGGDYYEIGAEGTLSEPLDKSELKYGRSALFHPTTGRFAGFRRHNDWITYEYTDALMQEIAVTVPKMLDPSYRFSMVDFAEDPRKLIVRAERHDDPGSYFFIDFTTGDVSQIAPDFETLPPEWVSEKKPIDYKAADGLNIHAYLTLPPNREAKNLPLVVLPHGGPHARDYIDYDWQAQALASLGYCVLQPNFRGSAGYGKTFTEAGLGQFGRKMQTDLSDGVRYLVSQGIVDPKRVAIVGASYGGYAALAGATLDPGVYTCAISVAGVSEVGPFLDFIASNHQSRRAIGYIYWKALLGDPQTYDDISPARQAHHASCPILLIHGTDDTVVPISQSQRMEKALRAANKPVEFITYKGQDHWETIESARIEMMTRVVDFLGKHNPA